MRNKQIEVLGKKYSKPISCLTAYSPAVANILDGLVDMILVGDSLGSTLYGMNNTQKVTLDMMKVHGEAVFKNVNKSISVIDMPFGTYKNTKQAFKNAKHLISFTQAKFVKLEILKEKDVSIIRHLSDKNIKVIAHIGVTPQSYKDFSKIKVVGRNKMQVNKLVSLAKNLEDAGAKLILIECVTKRAAEKITNSISIPTIGIGSSNHCNGQVLVFDDLINLSFSNHTPKFVKNYMDFRKIGRNAVKKFVKEVKNRRFPSKKYSYS